MNAYSLMNAYHDIKQWLLCEVHVTVDVVAVETGCF